MSIILGDALEELKKIESNSIDCCITSPPYNLNNYRKTENSRIRTIGSKTNKSFTEKFNKWYGDSMSDEDYISYHASVAKELFRIVKKAIFYNHSDRVYNGLLESRGDLILKDLPVRQRLIWVKNSGGNVNNSYFTPTHEFIYFIPKNGYRCGYGGVAARSVITTKPVHKNEKEELVSKLLSLGFDGVIDPFAGSGTTGIVAKKIGIRYILIEKNAEYFNIINKRFDDLDYNLL